MQSLLSTDARVRKCPTTTCTNLQGSTNSLAIVGDQYNGTRTRDAFASLIMSIQAYDSPSFWNNLSSNNEGSVCELLLLEECMFHSVLVKCGLIRRKVVSGEMATIIRNDTLTFFKSEYELDIEINKSKVDLLVQNKVVRRNVYFLRIGKNNNTSFVKASQQYKHKAYYGTAVF